MGLLATNQRKEKFQKRETPEPRHLVWGCWQQGNSRTTPSTYGVASNREIPEPCHLLMVFLETKKRLMGCWQPTKEKRNSRTMPSAYEIAGNQRKAKLQNQFQNKAICLCGCWQPNKKKIPEQDNKREIPEPGHHLMGLLATEEKGNSRTSSRTRPSTYGVAVNQRKEKFQNHPICMGLLATKEKRNYRTRPSSYGVAANKEMGNSRTTLASWQPKKRVIPEPPHQLMGLLATKEKG